MRKSIVENRDINRQKSGAAVPACAVGAAILGVLYMIVFYGYIYINRNSGRFSYSVTHPDVFVIVGIVLTLISFALVILYAMGLGKSYLLAAAMLATAVRILVGFVGGILSSRVNQTEYAPNIYNYLSIVILFAFAFAGIILLANPNKIGMAGGAAAVVLVLNAVMLIISVCQNIEAYREYMAWFSELNPKEVFLQNMLHSLISNSFYYLSQILMCLSIVLISRKLKTDTAVPELQLSN